MDDFISNENLKLFRRALSESSDQDQRRVLLVLLRLLLLDQSEPASAPTQQLAASLGSDHEPVITARAPHARS